MQCLGMFVCRLLLATHTRLMWYFPDTHEYQVLHEGEVRGSLPRGLGCRCPKHQALAGC